MEKEIETLSLELLCDMHEQLGDALSSLRGKEVRNMLDRLFAGRASYIGQAAEGYILLRKASRIDASRLLIRPAVEAMIQIIAVRKDPSLLYRIVCAEGREHSKWARLPSIKAGKNYDAEDKKRWNDFKQEYTAQFPEHKLVEKKLFLIDVAKVAFGTEDYYNRYYRRYCKFVHPTLAAVTGSLNRFGTEDNRTMADSVFCGLEAVTSAGGEAPRLEALRKRLFSLRESGNVKSQGQ